MGGQEAVGHSCSLGCACSLLPHPVPLSLLSQPAASSLVCLLAGGPGFVSQGLSSVHCKDAGGGGGLPTLGEGLLGWAGDKALQSEERFGVGAAELD